MTKVNFNGNPYDTEAVRLVAEGKDNSKEYWSISTVPGPWIKNLLTYGSFNKISTMEIDADADSIRNRFAQHEIYNVDKELSTEDEVHVTLT